MIDIEIKLMDLIPNWMINLLPENINKDKFIEFYYQRPPIWLRIKKESFNCVKTEFNNKGIKYSKNLIINNAYSIINNSIDLYSFETFKQGYFEIQDIASQVVGIVCKAKPGEKWWDTCAGGGGKTLLLAAYMNNKGTIVASDIREEKLNDLKIRAKRNNYSNIKYSKWDGNEFLTTKFPKFDGVLVDSPCSGSGTWRRNPDATWRSSLNIVKKLSIIQLKILTNASFGVRLKGVLIYSTCSIFNEENLLIVKKFIQNNSNFELEPFLNPINGIMTNGTLLILPWHFNSNTMFIAKFRKIINKTRISSN